MSISSVGSTFIPEATPSTRVQRAPSPGTAQSQSDSISAYGKGTSAERSDSTSQSTTSTVGGTATSVAPSAAYRPDYPPADNEKQSQEKPSQNDDSMGQTSRHDAGESQLSEEDQSKVDKLEKRDVEVRAHEAAHIAAAGQYAVSGANFSYETGPDGKRYAVGGDVSISLSEEQTPEATVAKMEVVIRAAMAPAQPSNQDHRVAAEASQKKAAAQREAIAAKSGASGENSGDTAEASVSTSGSPKPRQYSAAVGETDASEFHQSGLPAITRQVQHASARKAYGGASAPVSRSSRSMNWTM